MDHKSRINLDANASYGLIPEVERGLLAAGLAFHNPSSIHSAGQRSRAMVESARADLAALIGLPKNYRVVWTSGATEANNSVFANLAESEDLDGCDILISGVEHPSVLAPAQRLKKFGASILEITVDQKGQIDLKQVEALVSEKTKLISFMLANNETGHIFPVAQIAKIVRAKAPQALIHTDAVQAVGKVPVDIAALDVDFLSVSGHKFGALSGVGALVVGPRVKHQAWMLGGSQEVRWRAGTENVLGILSLGLAAKLIRPKLLERAEQMRSGIQAVLHEIKKTIPDVCLQSSESQGLPNTLSLRFPSVRTEDLIVAADLEGVSISSGSACSSGKPEPSHTLIAMGLTENQARETVRISIGAELGTEELIQAAKIIAQVAQRMRREKQAA